MFPKSLVVAILVLSAASIGVPRASAQRPTPTPKPATLTVQFACPDVPWSCLNTKTATKWQMYEVFCDQNNFCRFKHVKQVNNGETFTLKSLAQWRLYMGPEDDSSEKIYDCGALLNQISGSTVLEIYGACSRNPALCSGSKRWQIYECVDRPDGSCPWEYIGQYDKDCLYTELLALPGGHLKIHWGDPHELDPTETPTATRAPTGTRTATPTRWPTVTKSPTMAAPPTQTVTPPRPTATKAPVYRLGLPRLSRP